MIKMRKKEYFLKQINLIVNTTYHQVMILKLKKLSYMYRERNWEVNKYKISH